MPDDYSGSDARARTHSPRPDRGRGGTAEVGQDVDADVSTDVDADADLSTEFDPATDVDPAIDAEPEATRREDPEAFYEPPGTRTGERDESGVVHPDEVDREFDWRGWTLVAAIFVSFVVIPGTIVLYPHVGPAFGLSFWDAYLVLPMLPAVVLAALAVWATTRP